MKIKWCKKCVLPNTRPNLLIDETGICNACQLSNKKTKIEKIREFKHLVKKIKKKNKKNYDCLIPVSGGKDSTWQVIKCLQNNLVPLAVTWKCPSRTFIGQKNLDNLISLGVDHFDITINPKIERKFILKTFNKTGSPAVPMHLAIFNLADRLATKFKIPLIVWGENSAKEYGFRNKLDLKRNNLDNKWIYQYGATNKTDYKNWLGNGLNEKNLILYSKSHEKFKPTQIFLGDYFYWDTLNSFKIAKKYGFTESKNKKTGYYNFADIDDNFISIHHFIKWYKFGFDRAFDNLSLEIRNGRISRTKALKVIKKNGFKIPHNDIKIFCEYLGISKNFFFTICEKFRNKKIWKYDTKKKKWFVKDFLVKNFKWN